VAIPPEQQAHRDAFGRAIAVWFRQNSWSQQTPHEWALAAGSEGPWNSQVSLCQRGIHDPKATFWISLARFNRAVAEQDLPPNLKARMREHLRDAKPFCLDDGTVASASNLFGMFIGEQEIPRQYSVAAFFTAEQAKQITQQHQLAFKENAKARMVGPAEAWLELRPLLSDLTSPQQETLSDVLTGWACWEPDQLIDCYEPVQRALARWSQGSHG
jgi:hypothetical protein